VVDLFSVSSEERQAASGLWVNVANDKMRVVGGRDRPRCPRVQLMTPRRQNAACIN